MTDFFDPNKSDKPIFGISQDAHYFKIYKRRGDALGILGQHGVVWELTPTGWVERLRRDWKNKPDACEICGILNVANGVKWYTNRRSGKITNTLGQRFLCSPCNQRENHA